MVKKFEIVLEGSPESYSPGSTISGSVIVKVKKPKKSYRDIKIYFTGKAEVHWTEVQRQEGQQENEESGAAPRTEVVHYGNSQALVQKSVSLWKKEGDEKFPEGEHSFPFQFSLPPDSPSSFEGTYGWIRYNVQAKISRGPSKEEREVDKTIQVYQELKSGDSSSVFKPVRIENQKSVGFWCCASGQVDFTVDLEQTGFIRGKELPFRADINNGCSRTAQLNAKVTKEVTYTASDGRRKTLHDNVVETSSRVLQAGESETWESELSIPPQTHLTIKTCGCIGVEYVYTVTLSVPWALDSTTTIPVVINHAISE